MSDERNNIALHSQSIEAVWVRRQAYWANGFRMFAVYNPGAVDRDGQPIRGAGKRGKGSWNSFASEDPPRAVRVRPDSDSLNTAFLCSGLAAIDCDVRDQQLVDDIVAAIETIAGPTPLVRQDEPPKLALLYRAETPFNSRATAKLQLKASEKPTIVEIKGRGAGIMADGIHPNGMRYRWLGQHPLYVKLSELPPISEAQADAALAAAEAVLRAAGAVDWVNPNAPPYDAGEHRPDPRHRVIGNGGESGFFFKVNRAALEHAEDWVPTLFPAVKRPAPNGAWRVPAPLRGLPSSKQDLSIDPQHGIKDFLTDQPLTPIDVVLEYGGPANSLDAAIWLCERMGIPPERFGYRDLAHEEPPPPEPPDWDPPAAESPDGRSPPERVIMVYAGQRHIAANLGLAALRDAHVKYFVRGQNLVRVVATSARSCDGDDITLPAVLDVPLPLLGRALGQSARWMRHDAKGRVLRTDPPLPIVQQIGSMVEDWPFPPLHGLLTTPTLRPDGSLLRNPGYDHSTGLFLALPNGFELPPILERPSRRHAESGLELLLGLLPEFDFDSDASRSVALSLLISPIVRASMTTCRST
ncbi:MAG: bifunctional DNA primase/polymerase [Stellaceae bacterium]